MELAKIEVNDFDGSPVAEHNMPCAVCRERHAVLQMHLGQFQPCWQCMKKGYGLVILPHWVWHVLSWFFRSANQKRGRE